MIASLRVEVMQMFNKISEKTKSIIKIAGVGVATLGVTAFEIAASIEAMNKIVEGCDENNPASFGQTLGVVSVAIGSSIIESGTVIGGMYLIEEEIDKYW